MGLDAWMDGGLGALFTMRRDVWSAPFKVIFATTGCADVWITCFMMVSAMQDARNALFIMVFAAVSFPADSRQSGLP